MLRCAQHDDRPCSSVDRSSIVQETAEADVLVIGVVQTPVGPAAAPGLTGVDEALGGTLADTLTY